MIKLILILLAIWVALSILGFIIEGLFWLAVIGIVLFLATSVWGWLSPEVPLGQLTAAGAQFARASATGSAPVWATSAGLKWL